MKSTVSRNLIQTLWSLVGEGGPGICAFNNLSRVILCSFSFSLQAPEKTEWQTEEWAQIPFLKCPGWLTIWLLLLTSEKLTGARNKHWPRYWKYPNPLKTLMVQKEGGLLFLRGYYLLRLTTKTLSHSEVWLFLSDGQERGKILLTLIKKFWKDLIFPESKSI